MLDPFDPKARDPRLEPLLIVRREDLVDALCFIGMFTDVSQFEERRESFARLAEVLFVGKTEEDRKHAMAAPLWAMLLAPPMEEPSCR
jgi:hypothetical protein